MSNTKTTVTATDNTIELATLSNITGGVTQSSTGQGCTGPGCFPDRRNPSPFPGGPKQPFPFPRPSPLPFPGPRNPLGDLFDGSVGGRIGRAVGGQ